MQIRTGYTSANNTTTSCNDNEKTCGFLFVVQKSKPQKWMITNSLNAHVFQTDLKKGPTKNPTARALCIYSMAIKTVI